MEKKVVKKTIKKVEKVEKSFDFNPKVWDVEFNQDLVAQVLYVQTSNARTGTAHAKSRDMVSGGGRKPWRQKGTGRARHGSTRSPIWVGGGVTFVPNERNWKRNINKKMIKKAISIMLSQRLRDGAVEIVNMQSEKSMKEIRSNLMKLVDLRTYSLVVNESEEVKKAVNNVEKLDYSSPMNLSLLHIVKARKLLISEEAVKMIEKRLLNEK